MLILAISLQSEVWYVNQDGTGHFLAIQEAIEDAQVIDGDIIIIYEGIYYENIDFIGKNITVASRYYELEDEYFIDNTIIHGEYIAGQGVVKIVNEEDHAILVSSQP